MSDLLAVVVIGTALAAILAAVVAFAIGVVQGGRDDDPDVDADDVVFPRAPRSGRADRSDADVHPVSDVRPGVGGVGVFNEPTAGNGSRRRIH